METNQYQIDRLAAKKKAEDESQRADMKQHADKLIQGFEKLEESHAKRAIWELFQNAIDLSDKCEVEIVHTDNSIVFKHNGKPFTTKTLSCLIKQVSSKNADSNDDEIGQYGTGFITTHSFGKKILISGSLEIEGYYLTLDDFEIDRKAQNSEPELIDKLLTQQTKVFKLVEEAELSNECSAITSFSYQTESELEKQNAEDAISGLRIILPYVMVINEKLESVTVNHKDGSRTFFSRLEPVVNNGLLINSIKVNDSTEKIYSLHSSLEELVIILPLSDDHQAILLNSNLSRLFLYYPLIGTEAFGFNYLLHSKKFAPTEPRDGIHLKSKNEQVQQKEFHNRQLIQKAIDMICAFVNDKGKDIHNSYNLAHANFNTYTGTLEARDYYKSIKSIWSNSFKEYKIVECSGNKLTPAETLFISDKLLIDDDYLESIYSIMMLFWKNIPNRDIAKIWTRIVSNWEDDTINFIGITDILEKVQSTGFLTEFDDKESLIKLYQYVTKYCDRKLFSDYNILPNIKGEFRKQSQLHSAINIDDDLVRVADRVIPDIPKKYIDHRFVFDLDFEPYDRKQLSKDINSEVSEVSKNVKKGNLLPNNILTGIIELCKIFPSLDNTATRGRLTNLACIYYDLDPTFIQLPTINNKDIDWLTPMRSLLKNLIWDINAKEPSWIKDNIDFVEDLVDTIHDYYEFNEIIQTLPIYPNQNYKLCEKNSLKAGSNIPIELKDLYDKIVKPNAGIRNDLILEKFEGYVKEIEIKKPKDLGEQIEGVFLSEMAYSEINEHPYRKDILWIIQRISDDFSWADYFQIIEDKKPTIMMSRIADPDTKNDLFSILGLDKEQIALLGELARNSDIKEVISRGQAAILEEQQKNADFEFKYAIGTHIEKLVREKIGSSLSDFGVQVRNQQGGQDIVIELNNETIYYIEVKSRWDSKASITISQTQIRKAMDNNLIYALCCVDMSTYKSGEPGRYNVQDINIIMDRINVLREIGGMFNPLLSGIFAVKDVENEVSLTGDYRGVIPQSIVKSGEKLDAFVDRLTSIIRLK